MMPMKHKQIEKPESAEVLPPGRMALEAAGIRCPADGHSGCAKNFNSQRVQALINEILQTIIHKAMLLDAAAARENRAGNADTKVRAEALGVGTGMTRMRRAFIKHFELRRLQTDGQHVLQIGTPDRGDGTHGALPVLRCLLR
jgi:hypothetical protein